MPDTIPSKRTDEDVLAQKSILARQAAFASAEASLALEGLHPSGPLYERVRADVIAGRISSGQAAAGISASFGPDVE